MHKNSENDENKKRANFDNKEFTLQGKKQMSKNNFIQNQIKYNGYKFIFNQDPFFTKYFILNNAKEIQENHIKFTQIKQSFIIGGYKINKMIASFWFGAFLFAMQSYFLRQNLKLTDVKFISD